MPIVAEEDDDDVPVFEFEAHSSPSSDPFTQNGGCGDGDSNINFITAVEDDDDDGDSTFELCTIPSVANLSDYDPLNTSLGRSIGNSTSSRHRYMIIRRISSSELNKSIGKSIGSSASSSRRLKRNKGGNTTSSGVMNRSSSTGSSRLLDVVEVVPNKKDSIDTKYFVDYSREIGRGTKTIVRKCVERATGNRYAVKSVKLSDKTEYRNMRNEANLLTALDHPSIIKIYDTFEDDKYLHMVVEICKGGELYDHVIKSKSDTKNVSTSKSSNTSNEGDCSTSEEVAAVIVRRVVDAVAYLHENNIVHRDLKLENLLFKSHPSNKSRLSLTDIRVIDFGLSRRYNTHHRFASLRKLTSFVGTKFYVAPEVLDQSYTHAADLWSIGVLAYALLSAKAPFVGRDDTELFDMIRSCGVAFPSPDFDNVSDDAKNFIRALLVKDEASRPTASELLTSPWMIKASRWKEEIDSEAAAGKEGRKSIFSTVFGCFGKSTDSTK